MRNEEMAETTNVPEGQGSGAGSCLMWLLWGGGLSFTLVCSVFFLVLLIPSTLLNLYMGWQLSGYEVVIRPRSNDSPQMPVLSDSQVAVITATATSELTATLPPETLTPVIITSTEVLVAQATEIPPAGSPIITFPDKSSPVPPTVTPAATAESQSIPMRVPTETPTPVPTATLPPTPTEEGVAAALAAPEYSYTLIPFTGERDQLPGRENGDLNLKLRDPQRIETKPVLVDIRGEVAADPPRLSTIFEPRFTAVYKIHDWDWACNCKGALLEDAALLGIATTPGQQIFIPHTEGGIYQDKYYALLLYAAEDTVTFSYSREGTVGSGFVIHYLGLQTDPTLLSLYRQSQGNELPGLSLDTPVGTATGELIVAVRAEGTFLDARSGKDWW